MRPAPFQRYKTMTRMYEQQWGSLKDLVWAGDDAVNTQQPSNEVAQLRATVDQLVKAQASSMASISNLATSLQTAGLIERE